MEYAIGLVLTVWWSIIERFWFTWAAALAFFFLLSILTNSWKAFYILFIGLLLSLGIAIALCVKWN